MKKIIGILIAVLGIALGLYVEGWLMFIQPIIAACKAFAAGTLTGMLVGITVIKCIFASTVGGLIAWVSIIIGEIIIKS